MAVALIVAAGRGERLGLDRPKALVTLCGRPMLEWSVAALQQVPAVSQVIVALPEEALDRAPEGTVAVAGGVQRSHSVRAALAACAAGDPIIVHDAARPLATPDLFIRALEELEARGMDAIIAATPVTDTIKETAPDGRTVTRTLDRSRLWSVQTPQVFRRAALEAALARDEVSLSVATDDAWLVERAGGTVGILDAGERNLKITTADDLRMAELLLTERAR
jgi:2-C-methyl-D-erythritol 4-phosphate cytidylyltransferase